MVNLELFKYLFKLEGVLEPIFPPLFIVLLFCFISYSLSWLKKERSLIWGRSFPRPHIISQGLPCSASSWRWPLWRLWSRIRPFAGIFCSHSGVTVPCLFCTVSTNFYCQIFIFRPLPVWGQQSPQEQLHAGHLLPAGSPDPRGLAGKGCSPQIMWPAVLTSQSGHRLAA